MSKLGKVAYKPVGLLLGAASGMVAAAVFKQVWKRVGHDDDAPNATDEQRDWSEILVKPDTMIEGKLDATILAGPVQLRTTVMTGPRAACG
jgi:hypothetical protein